MTISSKTLKYLITYMAGDIVSSENPGDGIRKWRELFNVRQSELARIVKVSPPVISDYERGRRAPGVKVLKKIVEGLLKIDADRGYVVARRLAALIAPDTSAIIDIQDFSTPIKIEEVIDKIEGEVLYGSHLLKKVVYGYTIIDSIQAIFSMSGYDFFRIMGLTPTRILTFTNVSKGRSPMIAVRVYPIKPTAIVLHGPRRIDDPLVIQLARLEEIPLILSHAPTVNELIKGFQTLKTEKSME